MEDLQVTHNVQIGKKTMLVARCFGNFTLLGKVPRLL